MIYCFSALHTYLIKNLLIFGNDSAIIRAYLSDVLFPFISTSLFSAEPRCRLVNGTGESLPFRPEKKVLKN